MIGSGKYWVGQQIVKDVLTLLQMCLLLTQPTLYLAFVLKVSKFKSLCQRSGQGLPFSELQTLTKESFSSLLSSAKLGLYVEHILFLGYFNSFAVENQRVSPSYQFA
jgi:hypothetical protein